MFQTHGYPRPQRYEVPTGGGTYRYRSPSMFVQVAVHSGTVRLYFEDQAAFDADSAGGVLPGTGEAVLELSAGALDYFEGPVLGRLMLMRAIGGAANVTLVSYGKGS